MKSLWAKCLLASGICLAIALIWIAAGGSNKIIVTCDTIANSQAPAKAPVLKVFVENSGSMDGYMVNGSQLKDCIYDYVSYLNACTAKTQLYYINTHTIPYHGSLQSYIKTMSPDKFKVAGGDRKNSDMAQVIGDVLRNVSDTSVCILVSDCILDVPTNDAQNFLTQNQITIKNNIINARKRVPSLSVQIMKFASDFQGTYYYPNGTNEHLEHARRPYYIWMFGPKDYLEWFNKQVPLSLLEKYQPDGFVAFTPQGPIPATIGNRTGASNVIAPNDGEYTIALKMNLASTLQPDTAMLKAQNYEFSDPNIKIIDVKAVKAKKSKYTAVLAFSIPEEDKITEGVLTILSPSLPGWIEESNDNTGTNIRRNLRKTTGIKFLIEGVADAFRGDKALGTIHFKVKRQ